MPRFVDVETPYMGATDEDRRRNLLYARACVRDCLKRDEYPFASHLFFTQPGILDDNLPQERAKGINAGKIIIEALPRSTTVVYTNLGISKGMEFGISRALQNGREVEYRKLEDDWEQKELELARRHSHSSLWGIPPSFETT